MTSADAARQVPWVRYALLAAVFSALWLAISLFASSTGASADEQEPSGILGAVGSVVGDVTEVTDTAGDTLRVVVDTVVAPAGEVVLALVNDGSIPHTLVVEDFESDLKLSIAGSGDVDSGSITLDAGEYVFYCDVAGHRGAGMEGTLTVE